MSLGQNDRIRGRRTNRRREHGPDVKIRGAALHVAERYLQLARDAHTGSDPIAVENYLQHAEHYFRLIATAQAAQLQAQKGDMRAAGESGPEDLDEDEDLGGLPDRFAAPGQQARQALKTNVVAPAASQPCGQRKSLVRRKAWTPIGGQRDLRWVNTFAAFEGGYDRGFSRSLGGRTASSC